MDTIPVEILYIILSYCGEYNIYLSRVSRLWYQVSKDITKRNSYTSLDMLDRGLGEKIPLFYKCLSWSLFLQAIRTGKLNILSSYETVAKREEKRYIHSVLSSSYFLDMAHIETIKYYFPKAYQVPKLLDLEMQGIKRDEPSFLEWQEEQGFYINWEYVFAQALRGEKVKLLNHLENKVQWKKRAKYYLFLATEHKSFFVFMWLRERGIYPSTSREVLVFITEAMKRDRLDLIEEHLEDIRKRSEVFMETSLRLNKLHIFRWLLDNTSTELTTYMFREAWSKEGKELLYSLNCPWDDVIYYKCIETGDIEGLKWFHDMGYELTREIISYGLRNGGKLVRDWLLSKTA